MRIVLVLFLIFFNSSVSCFSQISASDELYKKGSDAVLNKDYSLAVSIFKKMSVQNEYDAQYNLAYLIRSGKGVTQNYSEALFWALSAKLGLKTWLDLSKKNEKLEQDLRKANDLASDLIDLLPEKTAESVRKDLLSYLLERFKKKEIEVVTQLGDYFLIIVEDENNADAYMWYSVASALGVEGAYSERDKVERKLDSDTLVKMQIEAKRNFEDFKRTEMVPEKNVKENKTEKEYES